MHVCPTSAQMAQNKFEKHKKIIQTANIIHIPCIRYMYPGSLASAIFGGMSTACNLATRTAQIQLRFSPSPTQE